MVDIDCAVLVIGAGPTGLMAAHCLRRAGVDVRVVEKRTEPSAESRAGIMSCRSLELLASLGLADKALEQGVITTDIDLFVSGEQVGGLRYDQAHAADTPYQFALMIPQAKTERVLIAGLDEIGFQVDRDVEVTGFEQDNAGVRLQAKRRDGSAIAITAKWVIGADGAHSIVRTSQNVPFEGAKYDQNFLLGDVKVHWPLSSTAFRVFMHGDRIGLFIPLEGDRSQRVMTTDMRAPAPKGEGWDPAPLDLQSLQDSFREATCMDVTLSDPVWVTQFRTHHRIVDRYRIGRTFLAGDAAHIHSPAGGQGMNTGLQDAANLAWKLGLVLRHGADEELLDSYEAERLPVAQEVVRFTDTMFSTFAGQVGWKAKLRDALAPAVIGGATRLDVIHDKAFRKTGQIDIVYPRGRFVDGAERDKASPPAAWPGFRAPDARIGRDRDLFDLIGGYRFTLLALSRRRLVQAEADEVVAALKALPEGVSGHLIARLSVGRHEGAELVETAEVFDRYGLPGADDQALVLVRPDGYVAWRAAGLDVAAARTFLADRLALAA